MVYNITNHELYELITRFQISDLKINQTTDYVDEGLKSEIDLIIKHLIKEDVIQITKDKKINNDLVYEIILDCYNVNSNLRHLIHKRVNIEDNYYLISCVVKALVDLNYFKYNKNIIEVSKIIDINEVYNLASIYFALEILKTNKYIVLLLLYLHNADQSGFSEVNIDSLIELVYKDIDLLLGEKQSPKAYIQALKKLSNVIQVLGGEIEITNKTIKINTSFYNNVSFNALTSEVSELEISYNNIEVDESYKIIDKIGEKW